MPSTAPTYPKTTAPCPPRKPEELPRLEERLFAGALNELPEDERNFLEQERI